MASSGGSSISHWRLLAQLRNYLSKSYPSLSIGGIQKEITDLLRFSEENKKSSEAQNSQVKPLTVENDGDTSSYTDVKKALANLNAYIPQLPSILSSKGNEISALGPHKNYVVPKWVLRKKDKLLVSRSCIDARTRHLVKGLEPGLDASIYWHRIEDLCSHLKKYPDTKGVAIKCSGISRLLSIIHRTNDISTQESASQALALIGYTDPVKAHGIRILSIDGGGVRGLVALELLSHIESVTGQPIHKLFDFICGVSTGAIVAVLIGAHRLPLRDCKKLYRDISSEIFSQTAIKGTASLVWTNSFYDSQAWTEILRANMGEMHMIDSTKERGINKLCLVSSLARSNWVKAYLFRNYEFSYRVASYFNGCSSARLWEAVRASAAAPGYFSEFKLNDLILLDGGVMVNNPTAIAIHEARQLWPETPLQSVVSIGTGRHEPLSFEDSSVTWTKRVKTIINSATDTEGVHTTLHDLLPGNTYFRLNPYLSEEITLDEIRKEKLSTMLEDTALYLRKNEVMLNRAVSSLLKHKTFVDKMLDAIALQRNLRNL